MPRDEEREKRLAAALRANLKRRKDAARQKAESSRQVLTQTPAEGEPDPLIP